MCRRPATGRCSSCLSRRGAASRRRARRQGPCVSPSRPTTARCSTRRRATRAASRSTAPTSASASAKPSSRWCEAGARVRTTAALARSPLLLDGGSEAVAVDVSLLVRAAKERGTEGRAVGSRDGGEGGGERGVQIRRRRDGVPRVRARLAHAAAAAPRRPLHRAARRRGGARLALRRRSRVRPEGGDRALLDHADASVELSPASPKALPARAGARRLGRKEAAAEASGRD